MFGPMACQISQIGPVYPMPLPRLMSMMTLCPEGKVSQMAGHPPIDRLSGSGLAEGNAEFPARLGLGSDLGL